MQNRTEERASTSWPITDKLMKDRIIKLLRDATAKTRRLTPTRVALTAGALAFVGAMTLSSCSVYRHESSAGSDKTAKSAVNPLILDIKHHPAQWKKTEHDYSTFLVDVRNKNVAAAVLGSNGVYVTTKKDDRYFVPDSEHALFYIITQTYSKLDGDPFPLASVDETSGNSVWGTVGTFLIDFAPSLLLIGVLLVMLQRMKGGGGDFKLSKSTVKFEQVIGASEAKNALKDIQLYLKDPKAFVSVGARPPKGVLLTGAPGTGKTRLAQALAGECGCNFIAATASDFSAMFFGVGINRVKNLFKTARENAPCIIFIDEADGLAKRSNTGHGGPAEAESNRIINQFLTEMNGFAETSGVIVVAATNFPERMDDAFKREGRFDRKIHVNLPDQGDRAELFKLFMQKVKAASDIDTTQLGRMTTGMAPSAIEYVVNHAALLAAREGAELVTMPLFMQAIEDCQMGEVNRSGQALTARERERVAVHEAGHAVIAKLLKTGNVEKVTILSRGPALGVTYVTQDEDKKLHLRSELENRIQMLLGGRCAELVMYNEASSGASSDLKEASRIAMAMVASLGLGDKGSLFSIEALADMNIQPDTKAVIHESEAVLNRLHEACLNALTRYSDALADLRDQLLKQETITGEAVSDAIARVDSKNTVAAATQTADSCSTVEAAGLTEVAPFI